MPHQIERITITLEGILQSDGTWTKTIKVNPSIRDPQAASPSFKGFFTVAVPIQQIDDTRTEAILFTDCLAAANAVAGIV